MLITNLRFYPYTYLIKIIEGTVKGHTDEQQITTPKQPPKKKGKVMVVIIVLALCVLVIIGIMWYIRRRRDSDVGGGKDCEKRSYEEVPMKDKSRSSSMTSNEARVLATGEENCPIIKNQAPSTTEVPQAPSTTEVPVTQVASETSCVVVEQTSDLKAEEPKDAIV